VEKKSPNDSEGNTKKKGKTLKDLEGQESEDEEVAKSSRWGGQVKHSRYSSGKYDDDQVKHSRLSGKKIDVVKTSRLSGKKNG